MFLPLRYSFQAPPQLDLHVRPTLGDREVTFTHVTEWIEKKLKCEFQVSPSLYIVKTMGSAIHPLFH